MQTVAETIDIKTAATNCRPSAVSTTDDPENADSYGKARCRAAKIVATRTP